jgi:uncharacterized protein
VRFLIDTNIFLHAVNGASPYHTPARRFLDVHRQTRTTWCTTWPILYEFLRVATHYRVFPRPIKPKQALSFVGALLGGDEVAILAPTGRHLEVLESVVAELGHPAGNLFRDIHTAALMREHGLREIITADTDFLQFRFLAVTNPLQS